MKTVFVVFFLFLVSPVSLAVFIYRNYCQFFVTLAANGRSPFKKRVTSAIRFKRAEEEVEEWKVEIGVQRKGRRRFVTGN
ncbi:hypothetical protein VNO77_00990 [Canavalia gladiata]|uniref:Uncharacterized protein n=1 Tax=Canavalia gladiata TaxID=3824 RepID=A0AAN9R1U3_CANGL